MQIQLLLLDLERVDVFFEREKKKKEMILAECTQFFCEILCVKRVRRLIYLIYVDVCFKFYIFDNTLDTHLRKNWQRVYNFCEKVYSIYLESLCACVCACVFILNYTF